MALTDKALLEKRAQDHWKSAQLLAEANNEWAAVAAFYSCFQLAIVSFREDPVFSDFTAMKMAHQDLTPDDRRTDKHHVRKGSNQGFGMVDLMQILYKHVASNYRVLHECSTDVRYGTGIRGPITTEHLMRLSEEFQYEYYQGNLVHSIAKTMAPQKPQRG